MKINFYAVLAKFNKNAMLVDKYNSEISFWKKTIHDYLAWYAGNKVLYDVPPPNDKQKVKVYSQTDSAILTWSKIHQEKKYLQDLALKPGTFKNKKVLDIGSGPHPSALCFDNIQLCCLDPLLGRYLEIGFPIHYYPGTSFVCAKSEKMPFPNNYFDAVISVNAIDHVDDIEKTSKEIKRVLKVGGKIRMHIHYHKRTSAEPIEFTDLYVKKIFSWCKGFRKISESSEKKGYSLIDPTEKFALWSNF